MSEAPFRKEFFHISGPVLDLDLIETDAGDDRILPFYYWNIVLKATGETVGAISLRLGHNYHSETSAMRSTRCTAGIITHTMPAVCSNPSRRHTAWII